MAVALARPVFFVRASAQKPPKKTKLHSRDVKRAIQHAELLCYGYEDTPACRAAWDRVEEISSALAHQRENELLERNKREIMCEEDPKACIEFDL
jgi:CP12 domain